MIYRWIAGLLLSGIISTVILAQQEHIRFEHINIEDGLSQSAVTSIIQDRHGFMWFGTQDGLNRFDGYRIKIYKHDPERDDSLSGNYVLSLFEDRAGIIWIGTRGNGLNRFNEATRHFTSYQRDRTVPGSLSHSTVNVIFEDKEGRLWVGTSGGLNRATPKRDGRFKIFRYDEDDPTSLRNDVITAIYEDRAGNLWIGTAGGLSKMDRSTERFSHHLHNQGMSNSLSHNHIKAIYEDKAGVLWVGTYGGGLNQFDRRSGRFRAYRHDPLDDRSLGSNEVRVIYESQTGDLWIGTDGGLNKLDRGNHRFIRYTHNPANQDSLSRDRILSLYEDRSGILWIGVTGGGVNKLNPANGGFRHIKHNPVDDRSLSDDVVWSFLVDRADRFWVASDNGLNRFDKKRNRFQHFLHEASDPHSLSQSSVRCLLEDSAGRIWIGTYSGGLNQFDEDLQGFVHYRHAPGHKDTLSHDAVRDLIEDHDGGLWIATQGGGLNRMDRSRRTFQHYRHNAEKPDSLSDDTVWTVYIDRRGTLWAGTDRGLNRLNPKTNTFDVWIHNPKDPNSLGHNLVNSIVEDRDHEEILWIATDGSLNRFDLETGLFINFTEKNGLPNEVLYSLQRDNEGFLWMGTNKGLSRFDPRTETFKNFGIRDGLQSYEFNLGSCFKNNAGELFFGGINGYNAFFPKDIKSDSQPPTIVITDFLLFNKPAGLERAICETEHLKLTYKEYLFSFEFAALHYVSPMRNRYAYKLVGLDDDWIYTDAERRFATYTNLDPGQYTFKVKGSNKDNVWNDSGISMDITIHPPPWKTWWAYTLYLIALILSVIMIVYIRVQSISLARERSVAQREQVMLRRLQQIDRLKDDFLANTSHELRTPLNGIIGLADSLIDGATGKLPKETVANLAMIVSSGKRLSSLVNDILDFSKLKTQNLELQRKPLDIRTLTDVVFALCRPLVGQKPLELVNKVPEEAPAADADENRLQQVMYNLVGNAIKFSEKGSITVSARYEKDFLEVRVADTGIGIAADQLDRIFESFEQADGSIARDHGGTGLGLAVTRKLINLHGGTIRVESRPGEGSVFLFTLPISSRQAENALPLEHPQEVLKKISRADTSERLSEQPEPPDGEGFRVLIVDDEPVNRQVLVNHLSLRRYQVIEAGSGSEALELLNGEHFDLVLLDIMMPRMSGYEVCRRIRERHPVHELPVFFLTARDQIEDLVTGFESGINDYLTKPVSKHELLARVRTHLQLLDINRTLERKVSERVQELNEKNEELEEKNQELGAKNREMETLDGIVKTINREIALDSLLKTLLEQGLTLFPRAEKGAFILWNEKRKRFEFAAVHGYDFEELKYLTFTREELLGRYTTHSEELAPGVYRIRDFSKLPAADKLRGRLTPKCLLLMSLVLKKRIEGFLVFDNHTRADAFDQSDGRRLDRYRTHAVSALGKVRFLEKYRRKNEALKRTRDQLAVQDKLADLGTVVTGIAQEIRDPLHFVNNFAQISRELANEIRKELEADTQGLKARLASIVEKLERVGENACLINAHGKRADDIVQSMMALSLEEGQTRCPTDINELVAQYTGIALEARQTDDIQVARSFDPSIGQLSVASQALSRVLINLVNNAIEAVMEKAAREDDFEPHIRIETVNNDKYVEISFKDNGYGIAGDHLERIFTPFYTTKTSGNGNLGLGLSICHDVIVRGHGGELKVNTEPEEYTEFVIVLPKASCPSEVCSSPQA